MPTKITIIGPGRFGSYLADQIQTHSGTRPLLLGEKAPKTKLKDADLTILCVPMRNLLDCLETIIPHLKHNSILMDTCSVKTLPLQAMEKACEKAKRQDLLLVGTHPLFGPQSAPSTCNGQRLAVCAAFIPQRVLDLWQDTLKTVIVRCTPEEHDRQMATQVINHFVGRISKKMGLERVALSTKTHELFMDIADIVCGNSQELFEDMNRFNPQAEIARKVFLAAALEIHNQLLGKPPAENTLPGQASQFKAISIGTKGAGKAGYFKRQER